MYCYGYGVFVGLVWFLVVVGYVGDGCVGDFGVVVLFFVVIGGVVFEFVFVVVW